MTNLELQNDSKNNAKLAITVQLSTLWVLVMFNMVYADILGFVTPGAIEGLMTGYSGTVKLTQELLFVSALLLEIPIVMIYLSRVLKYKMNRLINIIASILTILFVVAGIEPEPFFLLFVAIEVVLMLLIIRTAWQWKNSES